MDRTGDYSESEGKPWFLFLGKQVSDGYVKTWSAPSLLLDLGGLNDNIVKGLTSLLSIEQKIEYIAYT
jgi:hypothetical protein